ncbi:MAG: HlyD family efflux transporter periplasmic adaptor subunit [Synergistaceae bacterium]|nr:HlyD family efflux transporter periplasmic adaptor subunit [Synergistaceae bacterium]
MEQEMDQNSQKKKRRGSGKNLLLVAVAILIMAGVGFWYYTYSEGQKYFITDNAKVTATLYPVSSLTTGKLVSYTVGVGSYVSEDEIVGTVDPGGRLRSPIDGQVVKSNATLNQTVTPQTPVAIIADINSIYIGANIEETDILKIKEGQSVIVELDAYPRRKINGYVSEVDMITPNAITGNSMSFSTSGTYTKVTQLIPIKIVVYDDIHLEGIIGTNATVRIRIK